MYHVPYVLCSCRRPFVHSSALENIYHVLACSTVSMVLLLCKVLTCCINLCVVALVILEHVKSFSRWWMLPLKNSRGYVVYVLCCVLDLRTFVYIYICCICDSIDMNNVAGALICLSW